MNIETICTQYGVARATLYRRLKAAGITPESLRDKQTGELTPEGIQAIAGILDGVRQYTNDASRDKRDSETEQIPSGYERVSNFSNQIEIVSLRKQLAETQQQLEEARQQIITLQAEALKRTEEHARTLTEIAQGQQRLLADREQRRGLFGWLRRRGG